MGKVAKIEIKRREGYKGRKGGLGLTRRWRVQRLRKGRVGKDLEGSNS